MSFDTQKLQELLPAIYRTRDVQQGGPLRALLDVIAGQTAVLEEDLAQLYDDQFIETCAPWVVPYIGDLVSARALHHQIPGIDTSRISMLIFSLGALLAALGGVIGGAFLGIYPGLDFEMLPIAFAVVIIGGMGSLGGAAIGALLVGLADNFGKALFPEISYFTLYAPMALILAVKPTGLFGRE